MKVKRYISCSLLLFSLIIFTGSFSFGEVPIKLIVDSQDITSQSSPILENNRTLVPIRFVAENLGAEVTWDAETRKVFIAQGEKNIELKIGSRIVNYNDGSYYQLSDVVPRIINGRTYVPVRLVSNGLGVKITWEAYSRTVRINSSESSAIESFYNLTIRSHKSGDIITQRQNISINIPNQYKNESNTVKLLLLNPETREGFIVAKGSALSNTFEYLPKVNDDGHKLLVAGIFNHSNEFLAGKVIDVTINVEPEVSLGGVHFQKKVTGPVLFTPEINFLSKKVDYEFTNHTTGKITMISGRDPFDGYRWTPKASENGKYTICVLAHDHLGNIYKSNPVWVQVDVQKNLSLSGVKENQKITQPVRLLADRNFDVKETTFYIKDVTSQEIRVLKKLPYGSYEWFPTPDDFGKKELYVQVKDTADRLFISQPISVVVDAAPIFKLSGVGPNQVLTESTTLGVISNVTLDKVQYIVEKPSGHTRQIYVGDSETYTYQFETTIQNEGEITIQAVGFYKGDVLKSEKVPLKIYNEEVYSSRPLVEKDKFLPLVSEMAVDSYHKTDMSAALQAAQAILETGWGQSLPVDKYSGRFSNNLFGIKGSGSRGSVVSNTWEVYNGMVYRIDDYFRAYDSVEESWKDHKSLLLNASRYSIFRDVMYDSSLGAWSIRRAGYATDPRYPIKLMRIIDEYELKALDKIGL